MPEPSGGADCSRGFEGVNLASQSPVNVGRPERTSPWIRYVQPTVGRLPDPPPAAPTPPVPAPPPAPAVAAAPPSPFPSAVSPQPTGRTLTEQATNSHPYLRKTMVIVIIIRHQGSALDCQRALPSRSASGRSSRHQEHDARSSRPFKRRHTYEFTLDHIAPPESGATSATFGLRFVTSRIDSGVPRGPPESAAVVSREQQSTPCLMAEASSARPTFPRGSPTRTPSSPNHFLSTGVALTPRRVFRKARPRAKQNKRFAPL